MKASSKHILLIGPLPPPVGGDTVSTNKLLSSRYWEGAGIVLDVIDTSSGGSIRLYGQRRPAGDFFRGTRILFLLIFKLPRVSKVLLWANTSFACTLGLPVILVCSLFRKSVILKLFGSYLTEVLAGFSGFRKSLTQKILGLSKYILPQTTLFKEELENSGFEAARLVLFPNFISDAELPPRISLKEFSGKCVFIGQIKKEKGVFDIIEALRTLEDLSCDFYGEIAARDRDDFLCWIRDSDNCNYCGVIAPTKVTAVIGTYDVLLLPSYHPGEGHPGVLLQAFASGTAVIASEWRSIPEIVEDRKNGLLVRPKAPEDIRNSLRSYAKDPVLYRSVITEAFRMTERFSERSAIEDLLIGLINQ